MSTKVDSIKIDELAAEFKQLSRAIEASETNINREVNSLISDTNSKYDEYYVRSTTSELDRMLREMRTLTISITERLNNKYYVLKQASECYRNDEATAKKLLQRQVGYSLNQSPAGVFGTLFRIAGIKGNVALTAAASLKAVASVRNTKNSEVLLTLPLEVSPLKANLTMNPKTYSEDVKKLQQRLKALGYNIQVDGYFGKQTLAAVNDYKNKYGLGNTGEYAGIVGSQTWCCLFGRLTGELKLEPNNYSAQVKLAQIRLKDLGYKIDATGYFDEKTLKAVNEFKTKNGIGNTDKWEGVLGPQTWDVLFGIVPTVVMDKNTTPKVSKVAAPEAKNSSTYTVKSGDNLTSIAKKLGISVEELAKANNIKNYNLINVGQVLKIPNGKAIENKPAKEIPAQETSKSTANKMVTIAEAELAKGFKEKNGNNITPYGKWYGMDGQPWCAMFVSWCANEAGILASKNSPKDKNGNILPPYVPKFASVSTGVKWYKENERFKSRTSGYEPKAGDTIFFSKNGQNHVGIVTAYDPKTKTVYTIEGNSSDSVAQRHYSLSDSYITGYGINGGTGFGSIPKGSTSGNGKTTR